MSDAPLLPRLQRAAAAAARAFADHVDAGPFVAAFSPHDPLVWINYAVPAADSATPDELLAAVAHLRPEFARRSRKLRFEFTLDLWPDLPAVLEAQGLTRKATLPLMAATRDDVRPTDPAVGFSIELIPPTVDHATLAVVVTVQRRAFDPGRGDAADSEVDEALAELRTGAFRLAAAFVDDPATGRRCCAGAAALTAGPGIAQTDVAELTGVGTAPEFRNRGVARALSEFLVRHHLAAGGSAVWLSAGDDTARRVYERIGFRTVGRQAHFAEPLNPAAPATGLT
jgi:ribosomal protein S18 acetylase RimI-like enzyme